MKSQKNSAKGRLVRRTSKLGKKAHTYKANELI